MRKKNINITTADITTAQTTEKNKDAETAASAFIFKAYIHFNVRIVKSFVCGCNEPVLRPAAISKN